jgi:monoamine oxidase
MPRRALELLEPSKAFNPQQNLGLKQLLNSVVEVLAFKLFLLYEKRWWETGAGIVHGHSVCDLPIRQTYYFRPDACERGTSQACPGYGLLMASYDDARAVEYWKGMEVPPEEKEKGRQELRQILKTMPTVFSGLRGAALDEYADPPPNLHKAPKAMLQRAKHQLALLHGMNVKDIPEPLVGAYADWSLDPFGGGWSHWQPQVNVEGVMRHVKKPLGDQYKVYIVGEAYSGQQGWVEGALTTAELVLQKEFGLQRPSWLPANYYLGW